MTKLYVIAGHGAGDPGACANGYEEAERVRALAARLKALGGDSVEVLDTSRNWYADRGISSLSIPDGQPLVELHADGVDDPGPHGGHVIIYAGYEPDDYDVALADFISSMFPGRIDKIVKRSDLANPRRAAARGINYRLLECCFVSNPDDITRFGVHLDDVARGILAAFGITAASPTQTQNPPAESTTGANASGFESGAYRCNVDSLNVRDRPSLSGAVAASYSRGETVVLDDWYTVADGYVWGRYTGRSGAVRYIAVGKATGKPEADDYLVKA